MCMTEAAAGTTVVDTLASRISSSPPPLTTVTHVRRLRHDLPGVAAGLREPQALHVWLVADATSTGASSNSVAIVVVIIITMVSKNKGTIFQ